jgi:hypothetical protein
MRHQEQAGLQKRSFSHGKIGDDMPKNMREALSHRVLVLATGWLFALHTV